MSGRRRGILAAVVLLTLLLVLGALFLRGRGPVPDEVEKRVMTAVAERTPAPTRGPAVPPSPGAEATPAPTPQPYQSPVDFTALGAVNEDIYAWLYIPGTDINYPILQRQGDDSYYIRRNSQGEKDQSGCIFTESTYNARDFDDPGTVVYGHHLRSGAMFGKLQEIYSADGALEEYGEIVIYLPDREYHYKPFAAVPFTSHHLLYYLDLSKADVYEYFLDTVRSVRDIGANIDRDAEVTPEDKLLILSTCLNGNNQKRYLVLAKRTDDRPTIP